MSCLHTIVGFFFDKLYSRMLNCTSSFSSFTPKQEADGLSLSTKWPTKQQCVLPVKFKQNVYHMKRDDIPEDAAGFKVCNFFFIFSVPISNWCLFLVGSWDSYSDPSRCSDQCFDSWGTRWTCNSYIWTMVYWCLRGWLLAQRKHYLLEWGLFCITVY